MTTEQIKEVKERFNIDFIYDESHNMIVALFPDVRTLHKYSNEYSSYVSNADFDIPGSAIIPSCVKTWEGSHYATDEELKDYSLF